LTEALIDILRDKQPLSLLNKIKRVSSGSIEVLIEGLKLDFIEPLKQNQEIISKYPAIKDADFFKSLSTICLEIDEDIFFTLQDTFELNDKNVINFIVKEKFNPSLLGLAGVGYAFLRLQDYYLVDSYFIPRPTEEFRLK
jgi:hypothetical protein